MKNNRIVKYSVENIDNIIAIINTIEVKGIDSCKKILDIITALSNHLYLGEDDTSEATKEDDKLS